MALEEEQQGQETWSKSGLGMLAPTQFELSKDWTVLNFIAS